MSGGESGQPIVRWRAARLAFLSTGLGELSHDLRGVLSPALLAAERLQSHPDPIARRSGDVLVRAVERAMGLVRARLDPLRQGLPVAAFAPVALREVIEAAVPDNLALAPDLAADWMVEADPAYLRQAWESLFQCLRAQGATRVVVSTMTFGRTLTVAVEGADDPPAMLGPLTEPAVSLASWELAIARDLIRACHGELRADSGGTIVVTLVRA